MRILRRAAAALCAAAAGAAAQSANCSGRGVWVGDRERCECNDCSVGPRCAAREGGPLCQMPLLWVGQPYMLEEWWVRREEAGKGTGLTTIPMSYRPSYHGFPFIFPPPGFPLPPPLNIGYEAWVDVKWSGVGPPLNTALRRMHELTGNIVTEGRYIVIGTGASQLYQAAMAAYSRVARRSLHPADPLSVYARVPHYDMYKSFAELNPSISRWNASAAQDPADVIEVLTHPNNPDGRSRLEPHIPGARTVHDLVYYWPHMCGSDVCPDIQEHGGLRLPTLDVPVGIFSFTKLTGHASSRFGWAVVKDPLIALAMAEYVMNVNLFAAIETQFRALRVLTALTDDGGALAREFFDAARATLQARWARVADVFAGSDRFVIESVNATQYLWVRCVGGTAFNCSDAFRVHGMWGGDGRSFGEPAADHFRVNLGLFDSEFDILLEKLRLVVRGGTTTAGGPPPPPDVDPPLSPDRMRAVVDEAIRLREAAAG